jgi:riboflavin synthase
VFTGIVETTGRVASLTPVESGARLLLENVADLAAEMALGDSLAVNGCCLTVTTLRDDESGDGLAFDILAQTLRVTNLGGLEDGTVVNLERAMRADGRLGGHFVQGHVDCTSEITTLERHGQDYKLSVHVPREFAAYTLPKGSITIDGISLTSAEIDDAAETATMWITPHTFAVTNLGCGKVGTVVNLEFDLLAKHIERITTFRSSIE